MVSVPTGHPWQYYAKLSAACFLVGGLMEGFMIKTGFYDRVTAIEAGRLEESREKREEFLRKLKQELVRQADERGVTVPAIEALRENRDPAHLDKPAT